MTKRYRNPLEVFQDKPTFKSAVGAKCFDCVGGGQDPYIPAIKHCPATTCPLHAFRPYK